MLSFYVESIVGATPINAIAEIASAAILTALSFSLFPDSSSKTSSKKVEFEFVSQTSLNIIAIGKLILRFSSSESSDV